MSKEQQVSTIALEAIDRAATQHAFEQHPALASWAHGSIDRESIRAFAPQLYMLLDVWPRMVSAAHAISEDRAVRRELVAALQALEGANPSPAERWLQTCAALGLFSDTVRAAAPSEATEACINDLTYLAGSSSSAAIASLMMFARNVRILCRSAQQGSSTLGLSDGPGAAFFDDVSYTAEVQERGLRSALAIAAAGDARRIPNIEHAALATQVAMRGMFTASMQTLTTA